MISLMGGPQASAKDLEEMLTIQPIFNVGVYAEEIHEMSEMAAVPFGQYAQSNQPVHHLLYLFAHAGRPDRTQFWARRVMNELYTPDNFPGDEDTGSMAAWYVLSALGFYPHVPRQTRVHPRQSTLLQSHHPPRQRKDLRHHSQEQQPDRRLRQNHPPQRPAPQRLHPNARGHHQRRRSRPHHIYRVKLVDNQAAFAQSRSRPSYRSQNSAICNVVASSICES